MIRVAEAAWLLELAGSTQVLAAQRIVRDAIEAALVDLVPGATTLLIVGDLDVPLDEQRLHDIERRARETGERDGDVPGCVHRIPVRYDGADLAHVAGGKGLSRDELVARHAAIAYRVAFVGFQPGFAYLDGLPRELHTPRRASPRAVVPAGSVAIGGEWTGIYPHATPGGWNLLGTTDLTLFAADADPPALLQAGDVVHFVPQ